MTGPADSSPQRIPVRWRLVGLTMVCIAAGAAVGICVLCRNNYLSRKLRREGVIVPAAVTATRGIRGSTPRAGTPRLGVRVAYDFVYRDAHYADEQDVHEPGRLGLGLQNRTVDVRIFADDPGGFHELAAVPVADLPLGAVLLACATLGLVAFAFGRAGLKLTLSAHGPPDVPITAEIDAPRLAPAPAYFARPFPRAVRYRAGAKARTAVYTLLILIPPAYAAARWHDYLAARPPGAPLCRGTRPTCPMRP